MTTKFRNDTEALLLIASLCKVGPCDVKAAWDQAEDIHIGWPHDEDAKRFTVAGLDFAISNFRDGKGVWVIRPNKVMSAL